VKPNLVRILGRGASFYSRAVDRLVKRGWLTKRGKPRRDVRFELKITLKGQLTYDDLQLAFANRLDEKLDVGPKQRKTVKACLHQIAKLNQFLSGDFQKASALAIAAADEERKQLHLPVSSDKCTKEGNEIGNR
jgi:DNA-binding MarR family transcriptional regulator